MRTAISVVFHDSATERRMRMYRIWDCAKRLRDFDITMKFLQGPGEVKADDAVLSHVDVTVRPERYRNGLAKCRYVANRRVTDIRKSTFSQQVVRPDDSYVGPVIVKTETNCGGSGENFVASRQPKSVQRVRKLCRPIRIAARCIAARTHSRWGWRSTVESIDYPIFESKHELPTCIYRNPHLLVERFLPERAGEDYVLRWYTFFGRHGLAVRSHSHDRVIKGTNGFDFEVVEPHPHIVAAAGRLGFDYGKFDYVVCDGQAILLDINHTPTWGQNVPHSIRELITERVVEGIREWLHSETEKSA